MTTSDELFGDGLYYFTKSLRLCKAPPATQAVLLRERGAAWELKYELESGKYLLASLTDQVAYKLLNELLKSFDAMPDELLNELDISKLSSSEWLSIRRQAGVLLGILKPSE